MRLINTKSLTLENFLGEDVPPYVILSHTWDRHEISFEDFHRSNDVTQLRGWDKIRRSCDVASSLQFEYIWIDTCCIDKSSSAELSEAINSMFRWYAESKLCIAFLPDVDSATMLNESEEERFCSSRWLARGWTLQEMIAPPSVSFYNKDWACFGSRHSLRKLIKTATNIPENILETQSDTLNGRSEILIDLSVAQKMSWAAKRQTTRPEDRAYCLLGLFDINMPLLYGEGLKRAFRRLQEEIIKSTDDESIYSWRLLEDQVRSRHFWGLLAESPEAFGNYESRAPPMKPKYLSKDSIDTTTISNRGIHTAFVMAPVPADDTDTLFLAFLDCEIRGDPWNLERGPVILLQKMSAEFVRVRPDILAASRMRHLTGPAEILPLMGYSSETHSSPPLVGLHRQIFVPHDYRSTRYPAGIIFYYRITESDLVVDDLLSSSSWRVFPSWSLTEQSGKVEIDFDISPIPSVEDFKRPVIIAVLPLHIHKKTSLTGWKTRLIIGIDPVGATCLGTPPALYFAPWCAFDSGPDADETRLGDLEAYKAIRQETLDWDMPVRASLNLQRVNTRLYYRVSLDLVHETDKTQ